MVQDQVVPQYVAGEIVVYIAPDRMDVVGAILTIIVLRHKVAAVEAVVVGLGPVNRTAPGQVNLIQATTRATIPQDIGQPLLGYVGAHLGDIFGDQRG